MPDLRKAAQLGGAGGVNQMNLNRANVLKVLEGVTGSESISAEELTLGGSPLDQLGLGMDGLERVLGMLERVEPLFQKFSDRFMAIKQWEAGQAGQEFGAQEFEMISEGGGAPQAMDRGTRAPGPGRPPPEVAPEGVPEVLAPIKIYQLLLESMAVLPEEMTVSEALKLARDQKPLILAGIEEKLTELFKTG